MCIRDREKADIELVNSFLPGDFVSGKATGNLKISGDILSPSALAELTCENVKISNFTLESIDLNSHITVNESVLIENGAETNSKDKNQRTPIFNATIMGEIKIINFFVNNFFYSNWMMIG